ncbi:MAG TPA: hypothetical protein VF702_12545 [Allosphingosinicella sp.]|jgi:hypothetical protein
MTMTKRWIVTLSDERPAAETCRQLRAAGLADLELMNAIGIATGTADEAAAARMRALPGVADIAPDMPVDITPPGEDGPF